MKTTPLLLALLSFSLATGASRADLEIWTSKDGKTAKMELVKVTDVAGEKTGEFKTAVGKTVVIPAAHLTAKDAAKLDAWLEPTAFDPILKDNLVKLVGDKLKPCTDATRPTKYYLFYQSASWCGPCKAFTPSLVDFYNETKPGNDQFELILITCDRTEDAMTGYAVADKMPWPMIKMSEVPKLMAQLKPPGNGIPNLTLTDTKGNILKASYDGETYLGPQVVVDYLKGQLKK